MLPVDPSKENFCDTRTTIDDLPVIKERIFGTKCDSGAMYLR